MTRVGLVLGAGGVIGQAYHAGVLAAFEREHGWDPRSADVIVGTSAGSVTGTLLRLGVPGSDLAALAFDSLLSAEGDVIMRRVMPDRGPLPVPPLRSFLRPLRPPSPALVRRVIRRPWALRPGVVAMTLLPRGVADVTDRAEHLDALVGDAWPKGLWICAARRDDGARVVFGRPGSPVTRVATAVLASCAIPGYFQPVTVNGIEYLDGGIHSPTNADVLRTERLDIAIVVSPMSLHGYSAGVDAAIRVASHRRLEREVRRLEAAGTRVIRFEPGSQVRLSMGLRAMTDSRTTQIVQAAYGEVKGLAQRHSISALLGSHKVAARS